MRKRGYYAILVVGVIALGLFSRELSNWLPKWIGDILWGLMVFFIMGFLFRDRPTLTNARWSAIFSIGVEIAKLYHTLWIDAFRHTTIGGLLLGHVFSIQNILCYFSGIIVGAVCEKLWITNRTTAQRRNKS